MLSRRGDELLEDDSGGVGRDSRGCYRMNARCPSIRCGLVFVATVFDVQRAWCRRTSDGSSSLLSIWLDAITERRPPEPRKGWSLPNLRLVRMVRPANLGNSANDQDYRVCIMKLDGQLSHG